MLDLAAQFGVESSVAVKRNAQRARTNAPPRDLYYIPWPSFGAESSVSVERNAQGATMQHPPETYILLCVFLLLNVRRNAQWATARHPLGTNIIVRAPVWCSIIGGGRAKRTGNDNAPSPRDDVREVN
jgi:hypothetical protein